MKLQKEFEKVKNIFTENLETINKYASTLKASGEYNNFEKRLTFDCLRAFIGTYAMCEWYEKYHCNDEHIFTLGKTALKELKVI